MDIDSMKGRVRSEVRKVARFIRKPMTSPPYPVAIRNRIEELADDVRYASLALAIQRLKTENIKGSFAELGVYQGEQANSFTSWHLSADCTCSTRSQDSPKKTRRRRMTIGFKTLRNRVWADSSAIFGM